jgi:hypothetical protein
MINYVHSWALNQMETFDLYPLIIAQSLPRDNHDEALSIC